MSARTITVAQLRQLVVDECDIDTPTVDTHVTIAMLTRWTSLAVQKLFAVLTELRGEDWDTATAQVNTVAGQTSIDFPVLGFQLRSLVWVKSATERHTLLRAGHDDMTHPELAAGDHARRWEELGPPRYALRGQRILFSPPPAAVYALVIAYSKYPVDVTADADPIHIEAGWDDFLIYEVAARVYNRQEKMDSSSYARNLAGAAEQLIRSTGVQRDENAPPMARRLHARVVAEEGELDV